DPLGEFLSGSILKVGAEGNNVNQLTMALVRKGHYSSLALWKPDNFTSETQEMEVQTIQPITA
ncbi:MAG: hypothetical protein LBV32_01010, partial [Tannerellaceae bacterium]|nr:hypothetical protein [Tannerellaceae bacterium]